MSERLETKRRIKAIYKYSSVPFISYRLLLTTSCASVIGLVTVTDMLICHFPPKLYDGDNNDNVITGLLFFFCSSVIDFCWFMYFFCCVDREIQVGLLTRTHLDYGSRITLAILRCHAAGCTVLRTRIIL